MKKGQISKSDAINTNDYKMVCGVVDNPLTTAKPTTTTTTTSTTTKTTISTTTKTIKWQVGNWALACDFPNNDLKNVNNIRGEDCSGACTITFGCTHYSWTTYKNGTCWMKHGPISKSDAVFTNDYSMSCGVIENPLINSNALFLDHFFFYVNANILKVQ